MVDIIRAYTEPLRQHQSNWPNAVILADRYERGGSDTEQLPFDLVALTEWPTDLHYTQYACKQPRRLTKDMDLTGLGVSFGIAAYDLDYDKHAEGSYPSLDDWIHLVRILNVIDHTPNLLYPTRRGARIVYRIKPITNPEQFEAGYRALSRKLAAVFKAVAVSTPGWYDIDDGTGDWTRLFRAPRVVRDGKETFNSPVLTYHDREINLLTFRLPAPQKKPRPTGDAALDLEEVDDKLRMMRERIGPGQRNRYLFASARHIVEIYDEIARDILLERLAHTAQEQGLDSREIDRTITSARRYSK